MDTATSATRSTLQQRHRAILPRWVTTYYERPIELVAGDGVTVTDGEGNHYLDAFGGILTTSIGYGVAELRDAVDRQLRTGVVHSSTLYLIGNQIRLAERIAGRSTVPDPKVFFTNSGTEANDTALMLAASRQSGAAMVAIEGSYHGRSIAAVAVTHLSRWKPVTVSPFDVVFAPDGHAAPLGTREHLPVAECLGKLDARLTERDITDVAALIIEPVQGVNGFREPAPGVLAAYHEVLAARGALLVADEVQTGWGRTGRTFWGAERHGLRPDLVTFAKGVANGFALGGVIGPATIMDELPASSICTFGGNPLATAAALATLEVIESRDLQRNADSVGTRVLAGLRAGLDGLPDIAEVRGAGLMIAVECGRPATSCPDEEFARNVVTRCQETGLLVGLGGRHGNVVRVAPPLTLSGSDGDRLVALLVDAARYVAARRAGRAPFGDPRPGSTSPSTPGAPALVTSTSRPHGGAGNSGGTA